MEMNARKPHLQIFALVGMIWLGVVLVITGISRSTHPLHNFAFGAGAALTTLWILHLMGYFASIRMLPRRGDILMISTATPVAGLIAYGASSLALGHPIFSVQAMLIASTLYAVLGSSMHHALLWAALAAGRKNRVVFDLLDHERAGLMRLLKDLGIRKYLEVLSVSDLKEQFLQQGSAGIHQIVISRGAARHFHEDAHLIRAHLAGIPIVDYKKLRSELEGRIPTEEPDSWSFVLTATKQTPLLTAYAYFKVLIEPALALVLGILFLPLMLVVAAAIRFTSEGPVLYRQLRTGYHGKDFYLIKFRSMRTDSEVKGHQWATSGDDRVTPIGKLIRKTRIDELPQLWNVICGEMTFCGPRPERPEFYRELKKQIPLFNLRTSIRPGITGWAQVWAGYAASVEESRTKLEYDLYYIKHVSPRLDLIIVAKTILVAISGAERKAAKPPIEDEDTTSTSIRF